MVIVKAKIVDPTHLELPRPIAADCLDCVYVVVTEAGDTDSERREWLDCSAEALRNAYGESEPDYAPSLIRECNPDYSV